MMKKLSEIKKVYFIGIKGVGMMALAQVLQGRKIEVFGSDIKEQFKNDDVLKRLNIKVFEGFNENNIPKKVDLFVASAAYLNEDSNNPEVKYLRKKGIEIFSYAQVVGRLFAKKHGIVVAGTHGKSTVTAMLGLILEASGADPTVLVGAKVPKWQSNARAGTSKYLVVEGDEYKEHFLNYSPKTLVLLNIDYDHPDFFKTPEAYYDAFVKMVKRVPRDGLILVNRYNKRALRAAEAAECQVKEFEACMSNARLKIPGLHNRVNAAAAGITAWHLGVRREIIKEALENFIGVGRRFEIKGEKNGLVFVDDYAHHPAEIKATLKGAREFCPTKKIWAVFQPHTFSRTEALLREFGRAFDEADKIIVLDIYASAREKQGKVSSRDLVNEIQRNGYDAVYIPTVEKTSAYLKKQFNGQQDLSDYLVISMGAGDIWRLSTMFLF